MSSYFTYDDLRHMKVVEGQHLRQVIYHYWQNVTNRSEPFEFLYRLELVFAEGGRLILGTSDESDEALAVDMDFDAEKQHLLLLHEFGGKLGIRTADFTANDLWTPVAGQVLQNCELIKEGDSYRSEAMLLDFGAEKLEMRPYVDGLLIEPFEDV